MKRCNLCNLEKPLEEFYRHKTTRDRKRTECKECSRKKHVEWGNENRQRRRAMRRKSARGNEKNLATYKRYCEKYPERKSANNKLNKAVKAGRIKRPTTCTICRDPERSWIHGHHEDYSKPYDVIWCCQKCHKEIHLKEVPA